MIQLDSRPHQSDGILPGESLASPSEVADTFKITQFKCKDNFNKLIELSFTGIADSQKDIYQMFEVFDPNTVEGKQLDTIASIVGTRRRSGEQDERLLDRIIVQINKNNNDGTLASIRNYLTEQAKVVLETLTVKGVRVRTAVGGEVVVVTPYLELLLNERQKGLHALSPAGVATRAILEAEADHLRTDTNPTLDSEHLNATYYEHPNTFITNMFRLDDSILGLDAGKLGMTFYGTSR